LIAVVTLFEAPMDRDSGAARGAAVKIWVEVKVGFAETAEASSLRRLSSLPVLQS
jgi:hypothetical protein